MRKVKDKHKNEYEVATADEFLEELNKTLFYSDPPKDCMELQDCGNFLLEYCDGGLLQVDYFPHREIGQAVPVWSGNNDDIIMLDPVEYFENCTDSPANFYSFAWEK